MKVRHDTASLSAVAARRRTAIAALAACATLLLVPAAAAQSQPEELWRAYPLEQSVTTGDDARPALSRAAAAAAREPAQVEGPLSRETGSWTALLLATALGLLLVAGVGAVVRRRAALGAVAGGGRGPEPELFFIAELPRAPARTAPVAASMPMALAPPRRRSAPGPVCQVRWLRGRGGGRFCAVVAEADGTERRVALSPPVASAGTSPPDATPETQRALRALAKDLRADGWRPLRAKGEDLGEIRWYTRRFKLDRPGDEDDGAG